MALIPPDIQGLIIDMLLRAYTLQSIARVFSRLDDTTTPMLKSAQSLRAVNKRWCIIVTKWFMEQWGAPSFAEFYRKINSCYKWNVHDFSGNLGCQPGSYLTKLVARYYHLYTLLGRETTYFYNCLGENMQWVNVKSQNTDPPIYSISYSPDCGCDAACNCMRNFGFECDVSYAFVDSFRLRGRFAVFCYQCGMEVSEKVRLCHHIGIYAIPEIMLAAETVLLFANPAKFEPKAFSGSRKLRF